MFNFIGRGMDYCFSPETAKLVRRLYCGIVLTLIGIVLLIAAVSVGTFSSGIGTLMGSIGITLFVIGGWLAFYKIPDEQMLVVWSERPNSLLQVFKGRSVCCFQIGWGECYALMSLHECSGNFGSVFPGRKEKEVEALSYRVSVKNSNRYADYFTRCYQDWYCGNYSPNLNFTMHNLVNPNRLIADALFALGTDAEFEEIASHVQAAVHRIGEEAGLLIFIERSAPIVRRAA